MSETHSEIRFLVVDLGPTRLGLAMDHVAEVFALGPMASLPWSPDCAIGAIYRGGRVVTVVNLATFLALGEAKEPSIGVLVEHAEYAVAFAVQGVEVVEGRQTVMTSDVRLYLEDAQLIVASLSTPHFDFHQIDLNRLLSAIAEAF